MEQGIYSTGEHSNKQENERGRGGQVYTKEAGHWTYICEESSGRKLVYRYETMGYNMI